VGVTISEEIQPGDKLVEVFKTEPVPLEDLIPSATPMVERYKHGEGPAVGTVQKTQGDVYVIHKGGNSAYRLTKNQPLYNGDTVVTLNQSRVTNMMIDRSVIILASNSKLTIDQSSYEARTNQRQSRVGIIWGRVRIIAENLGSDNVDYVIKTPTGTCGIRGSDVGFYVGPVDIRKSALGTVIMTGVKTTIVVTGNVGPSRTLTSFTSTFMSEDEPATAPASMSPSRAEEAFENISPPMADLAMPVRQGR
jgi:hypothetical protein